MLLIGRQKRPSRWATLPSGFWSSAEASEQPYRSSSRSQLLFTAVCADLQKTSADTWVFRGGHSAKPLSSDIDPLTLFHLDTASDADLVRSLSSENGVLPSDVDERMVQCRYVDRLGKIGMGNVAGTCNRGRCEDGVDAMRFGHQCGNEFIHSKSRTTVSQNLLSHQLRQDLRTIQLRFIQSDQRHQARRSGTRGSPLESNRS